MESIDETIEVPRKSALERITVPVRKIEDTDDIIKPTNHIDVIKMQTREHELPNAPEESPDIPAIPDMKKAEEDYNSIDYQLIAFNLWKNKAQVV